MGPPKEYEPPGGSDLENVIPGGELHPRPEK
jgi:hypothetical protein